MRPNWLPNFADQQAFEDFIGEAITNMRRSYAGVYDIQVIPQRPPPDHLNLCLVGHDFFGLYGANLLTHFAARTKEFIDAYAKLDEYERLVNFKYTAQEDRGHYPIRRWPQRQGAIAFNHGLKTNMTPRVRSQQRLFYNNALRRGDQGGVMGHSANAVSSWQYY